MKVHNSETPLPAGRADSFFSNKPLSYIRLICHWANLIFTRIFFFAYLWLDNVMGMAAGKV